ncbi:Splicing factor 3A subunit 2 [Coccomyxa viridis]|uniref:Splicing factor 3A subunit 2 n=1 Tax=Coccomyxa viridis TaxID=1274662 RepID=A0AAV1HV09_9CHLO|nr:Splicing factor 3A subunit 2 [Coccomyxa viridis]
MSFLDAREHGSKVGSGGHASAQNEAIDRRERLRRLALETIDLSKDPYFMRNHLGQYECRLCLTLHNNEGNYLAHTQGKRHQQNMAKRAAREAAEKPAQPQPQRRAAVKKTVKIGRPGYRVTKQFDSEQDQRSLLFQVEYPEIDEDVKPRHRFMSAYEQKKEACDRAYQYLLFAADPYEVVAFKIPNMEVDRSDNFFSHWDGDNKIYSLQLPFKAAQRLTAPSAGGPPPGGLPHANGAPPRPPPGMQGGPPPMPPMQNGFPGGPPGQGFSRPPPQQGGYPG